MPNSIAASQSVFNVPAMSMPRMHGSMRGPVHAPLASYHAILAGPQMRYRRSKRNATAITSSPAMRHGMELAAHRKLQLPAYISTDEIRAVWHDVLAPSCRRPQKGSSGNAGCNANTQKLNNIDIAFLRELQKFFTEQRVVLNVRIAPAQALLEMYRLVHAEARPAAPSFHGGVLPQSDTVDSLIRHLSIAHFFHPNPADYALRVDPAFASRLVGECLMALFSDGPAANALRFNEFDFSKALRIAKPIAIVEKAFAALLALKFGALPKNVREWAASMMLPHLHPSLSRSDTPPHIFYGGLEWANLAFGIDLIANLGLDHGDYSYAQIAGLADLALAGAKFNDIVGKEVWRIMAPTALQFAHAQKRVDLGTHDIGNPQLVQNAIRLLERAQTATVAQRSAAVAALGKQPRSRVDIARAVLEKWHCRPDSRPGRSIWNIFLGRRFCEGDPTLLEAYLKNCDSFVKRACNIAHDRDFPALDHKTKAEWSAFDKRRAGFFATILADALHLLPEDHVRDWSGAGFVIYRPSLSQWITARGGQPVNRVTDADIGIIVETNHGNHISYFAVSANKDFLIRRIDASSQAQLREHVIGHPQYYLSPGKLACREPCVESKVTWIWLATETDAPIQNALDSRIGAVAPALTMQRDDDVPQTANLLEAANLWKQRHTPFSTCFKSGAASQVEQGPIACGLDLGPSDLYVLANRAGSQYFLGQTADAVLTREIKGSVLAAAAGRFTQQFSGAAMPPQKHLPTTMHAALETMQMAGREQGALAPGFRLMPQDALRVDFLTLLMKMMEAAPSTEKIRRDLEKSRRLNLTYAPGTGWQADSETGSETGSAAVPNIIFSPQSGYRFRNVDAAKNVLVKKLKQHSQDDWQDSDIFVRVSPYTGGMFGPAMNLGQPATKRAAALPSRFFSSTIADRPGYAGLRFTIAPSATVNRMMSSRMETHDTFNFNLNDRIYQVDMNAYVPQLRLQDDILADAQEMPVCRDERGAQKKAADSKNRCLTAESDAPESDGIRFEQVHPGNDRRRDNYVQQEPVEGRSCQLPRREQTIVFPQNQGEFRGLNVIIIDGIFYQRGNDHVRRGSSPARNASSAAQYKRLGAEARAGLGLPQIAALPAAFSAHLIDQGPTRRPLVQYVRQSEIRPADTATNEITRISTRIGRDFFSRRSSPGQPAMGLIEVEEDIFYEFALPPTWQVAPAEVWLTRVYDQMRIDAFIQQATVADRLLSERFSVNIAAGHAATVIDIFRKCNMNDVLGDALQHEKAMRQLSSGNDVEIDDALLNYIDAEIGDEAEPTPPLVLNELEIALTAMMKSPVRIAEFRRTLRERYQNQRHNVVFNEVYIPRIVQRADTLHVSGAARALQDEWQDTRALFNDVYPELRFGEFTGPQEVDAAFVRVFDSRNVAVLMFETNDGQFFYLDSVSGTRPVPTRSELAQNDAHHVLVRTLPDAGVPNSLPFLTNLLSNFEAQSREADTERVLFSWVLANFPQADAVVRVKLVSRLEICHSCVTCCISFAEHYKGATMEFSSFPRAPGAGVQPSTTLATVHDGDLK